jgi:uncharacterized protein YdeI (YjbR/CyaY-like superfamily)
MEKHKGAEIFYPKTRLQWRKWLERNAQKKPEVYAVLYHKNSGHKTIDHANAVEEALCFGWIDSVKYKYGEHSAIQRFSPRKPAGNWSRINIERAERMIKEGQMTAAGQKMIDVAKAKGKWQE